MRLIRNPAFALAIAVLGIAAMLGGSLGMATAASQREVGPGFNLIGGPIGGDVEPATYVSCLPTDSWKALYIWRSDEQEWRHFFNTALSDIPEFVNGAEVGGIVQVTRGSGVVIMMSQDIGSGFTAVFPDRQTDDCV